MSPARSPAVSIIQIGITDPVAARAFYGTLLGLSEAPSSAPAHPAYDLGHGQILLLYPAEPGGARPAYPDSLGAIPVFSVIDLPAAIAKLRAAHIELVPAPWADPATGIALCPYGAFIGVRDPSGNALELLQPSARPG